MTQPQTIQEEFNALGEQLNQVNAELLALDERVELLSEQKQQIIGVRSYMAQKSQQAQALAEQQAGKVEAATAPIEVPEGDDAIHNLEYLSED